MVLPLWLVLIGVHVVQVARAAPAWPPFAIAGAASGTDAPRLAELRPGVVSPELAPGDLLLAAGGSDLRGLSAIAAGARLLAAADAAGRVELRTARGPETRTTLVTLPPPAHPWWRGALLALGFMIPSGLLLLRAPSRQTRGFLLASLCYTLVWCPITGGPAALTYAGLTIYAAAALLVGPLVLRAAQRFPTDRGEHGGWRAAWPFAFAVGGIFRAGAVFGVPLSFAHAARMLALYQIATVIALVLLLTRAYRRADGLGRRQVRWVVYAVYVGALPYVAMTAIDAIWPRSSHLGELAVLCSIMLPVGLLIAIVRAQLFDIDRLISATASYSATLALLFAVALLAVQRVASAVSGLSGLDPGTVQTGLSFALALAVIPAQRGLRPWVETMFFRERAALQQGVEDLLRALAGCSAPEGLLRCLGDWLARLIHPHRLAIYAQTGAQYAPVYVDGAEPLAAIHAKPPAAIEAKSRLLDALRARDAALDLGSAAGRRALAEGAHESGLAALAGGVLLPIHRAGELAAFAALGPKRSGDVYTPTELALLTAVAHKASSELARFDAAEIRRQGLAMQASLRRYVPGAIAEQLDRGQELAPREREVSVLFVDIRGYTALSQDRRPEDIFSTINRYTESVSRIVRECGGAIVEFNGDGMMAVFGAPQELPEKERAAVRAAQALVRDVGAITPAGDDATSEPLRIGVGIATGPAFVGNIRAVDRLIWSAIGNTTNLAARLQSLARELDAAIVVDATTAARAGSESDGFELRPAVDIRGRREPVDLYIRPQ